MFLLRAEPDWQKLIEKMFVLQVLGSSWRLLDDKNEYEKMSKAHNPYGDGKACNRILDFIKKVIK